MDGTVRARVMEQGEVKNMEPPESLKRLLVELGRCIERLLSSSEEVGELLKKMGLEGGAVKTATGGFTPYTVGRWRVVGRWRPLPITGAPSPSAVRRTMAA